MIGNRRDFLASFDYFAARGRAPTESPGDRNDRVVQWAWAWPSLAPHVTRLLYDAKHHVRCESANVSCAVQDGRTGNWTEVASHFSPSLTEFEAAIVFHAVIRPEGPPLEVTFYRGDDSYVVNGLTQAHAPVLLNEISIEREFPCDVYRAVRVRSWILRQSSEAAQQICRGQQSNSSSSGTSDIADDETLSTIVRATTNFCPSCATTFKNAKETDTHHRHFRPCRPPPVNRAVSGRIVEQQRDVSSISFRVRRDRVS